MRVHVIGAGLAGLAAALRLAQAGVAVALHEAGAAAGGRARSFAPPGVAPLEAGIHLAFASQRHLEAFRQAAGAPPFRALPLGGCDFLDLAEGLRWRVRPGRGPWWLLDPRRRTPGTGLRDLALALRLLAGAGGERPLGPMLPQGGEGLGARRLWAPLCVAVTNTDPAEAASGLLQPFLRGLVFGPDAARDPMIVRGGLSAGLIAPALEALARCGARLRLRQPLRRLELAGGRVAALGFAQGRLALGRGEGVILAVPPRAAARLLPGLPVPPPSPILTLHVELPAPRPPGFATLLLPEPVFALAEGRRAMVTIGAAEPWMGLPEAELAARAWAGLAAWLGFAGAPPPCRILRFRAGTHRHSPEAERLRPGPEIGLQNLRLAGDWVLPGVAATMDGAVRSGHLAADALLACGADGGGRAPPSRP